MHSNRITSKAAAKNIFKTEVLIVDDDPFNILSMELILKREGFVCHKAFNGVQALSFLENYYSADPLNENPGLSFIFMDQNMPEMDGLTCCRCINSLISQQKLPFIPIIFCSANDAQSDLEACTSAGMSGFISKPLTINKVQHFVRNFL